MEESIEEIRKLYVSILPKEGIPCAYCGTFATDKEHVTPKSWIEKAEQLVAMGINILIPEEKIVPSCHECNLIASARIFETFREKKLYIRWKLSKKYKKWLYKEQWTDGELEELGGDFRKHVVIYNEALKSLQLRLRRIGAEKILYNEEYFKKLYEK